MYRKEMVVGLPSFLLLWCSPVAKLTTTCNQSRRNKKEGAAAAASGIHHFIVYRRIYSGHHADPETIRLFFHDID